MMKYLTIDECLKDHSFMKQALERSGARFRDDMGKKVLCSFHNDCNPSGSVFQSDKGHWLYKCHACGVSGDAFTIIAKNENKSRGQVIARYLNDNNNTGDKTKMKSSKGRENLVNDKKDIKVYRSLDEVRNSITFRGDLSIEFEYRYDDPETRDLILYVFRLRDKTGSKSFRQVTPCKGGYVFKGPDGKIPLYKASELVDEDTIFVCEGEKTVEALRSLGFAATTSAGGSKAYEKSDWTILAGKTIIIWPDSDDPGCDYANGISWKIEGMIPEPSIRVLDPKDLGLSGIADDAADFIERCKVDGLADNIIKSLIEDVAAGTEYYISGGDIKVQEKPFPCHCIPVQVRDVIDSVSISIGCDPSTPAIALLCAVSVCIGNRKQIEVKQNWREPAIIWGAAVAGSSSGKSPAVKAVLKPLYEIEQENYRLYEQECEQYEIEKNNESLAVVVKPPICKRLLVSDTTVEALAIRLKDNPKGLLLHRDELAGWFRGLNKYKSGGDDTETWLSFWRGEHIIIDRKTGDRPTISVPMPFVSLLGTIQPEVLAETLKRSSSLHNGMLARFLFAVSKIQSVSWNDKVVTDNDICFLKELYSKLLNHDMHFEDEGYGAPAILILSDKAFYRLGEFSDRMVSKANKYGGVLEPVFAKADSQAARIALILHELKRATGMLDNDIVSDETMADAVDTCSWFMDQAFKVHYLLLADDNKEIANDLKWIREKNDGKVNSRQLVHRKSKRFTTAMAKEYMKKLEQAGFGRVKEYVKWGQGGKPSPEFHLY